MKKSIAMFLISVISLMATDFHNMSIDELMDIKDYISQNEEAEYKKEIINRIGVMSIDEKNFFKEYIGQEHNISHYMK